MKVVSPVTREAIRMYVRVWRERQAGAHGPTPEQSHLGLHVYRGVLPTGANRSVCGVILPQRGEEKLVNESGQWWLEKMQWKETRIHGNFENLWFGSKIYYSWFVLLFVRSFSPCLSMVIDHVISWTHPLDCMWPVPFLPSCWSQTSSNYKSCVCDWL